MNNYLPLLKYHLNNLSIINQIIRESYNLQILVLKVVLETSFERKLKYEIIGGLLSYFSIA